MTPATTRFPSIEDVKRFLSDIPYKSNGRFDETVFSNLQRNKNYVKVWLQSFSIYYCLLNITGIIGLLSNI